MAAIITPSEATPGHAAEVVKQTLGLECTYEEQYDLSILDDGALQIRADHHLAPRDMVERYRHQMSSSIFPPILVTEDGVLLDGHTRTKARKMRSERFDRAYVVPRKWHEATDHQLAEMRFTAQVLNSTNGQPLDRHERREMIRTGLTRGGGVRQVAALTGVPESQVKQIKTEMQGEQKVDALLASKTITQITREDIPVSTMRALGHAVDLHDKPFAGIVRYAVEAGLNQGEIKTVARSARSKGSDEDVLAMIEEERKVNAQRIADYQITGKSRPPIARQARAHLGFIVEREVEQMLEIAADQQQEHLDLFRRAGAKIEGVVAAQEALMAQGAEPAEEEAA